MSRAERGPEPAPRRERWSPDLVADVMTYAVAALLPLGVIGGVVARFSSVTSVASGIGPGSNNSPARHLGQMPSSAPDSSGA